MRVQAHAVPYPDLPSLDKYMLHRLAGLQQEVKGGREAEPIVQGCKSWGLNRVQVQVQGFHPKPSIHLTHQGQSAPRHLSPLKPWAPNPKLTNPKPQTVAFNCAPAPLTPPPQVTSAYDAHAFSRVFGALQRFAVQDLSNLYLDVAKDRLYIRGEGDASRWAGSGRVVGLWFIVQWVEVSVG